MTTTALWDDALIAKYDRSGPRYTSYPTALEFQPGYDDGAVATAVASSTSRALSLYVHIPFCHTLCYYCGCNKVITRHGDRADRYLDALEHEVSHRGPQFADYRVRQLHWGGGTPTFLSPAQLQRLMAMLKGAFRFDTEIEAGIEVDPRELPVERLALLRELGFNRISIGVQDFDPAVQQAVNRVQEESHIVALVAESRRLGFASINLDLIYGLPLQHEAQFVTTLDKTIALRPDRVSVFNYAHLPSRFAAQRKLKEETLPVPAVKLALLRQTINRLTAAGYQYIGMDHFALPDDELAQLQRAGQLHRNFQGYTTHGECDLLGLGVSAISQIGHYYLQNERELRPYEQAASSTGSAIHKGCQLDCDDLLRRELIKELICNLTVNKAALEQAHGIEFDRYFAAALAELEPMAADGLVELTSTAIRVTDRGRLLIRHLCMVFDRYLQAQRQRQFSRII